MIENGYLALASSSLVEEFLATFKDFPPRQKPGSFTIDDALAAMAAATRGKAAVSDSATKNRPKLLEIHQSPFWEFGPSLSWRPFWSNPITFKSALGWSTPTVQRFCSVRLTMRGTPRADDLVHYSLRT
jgi:hypothetical protein